MDKNITEYSIPTVYYSLDWDDNIMKMPTKIYLIDDDGNQVGMDTHEFAKYRSKVGVESFYYKNHKIVGFAPNCLSEFKEEGSLQFLIDIETAQLVNSGWEKLRYSINNGIIFAIITARGHSPNTLKKAVSKLIEMERGGISKQELLISLRKFRNLKKLNQMNNAELIRDYLNRCFFVPVSYGSDDAISPEIKKNYANQKFYEYVTNLSLKLQKKIMLQNSIKNKGSVENGDLFILPELHFLDDDEKNILSANKFKKEHGLDKLRVFLTKNDIEKEINEHIRKKKLIYNYYK